MCPDGWQYFGFGLCDECNNKVNKMREKQLKKKIK